MPDCPKEDIEAAMHANDDDICVDEPIHSMPLRPAAAAKPATRTPSTIIKLHAVLVERKYCHFLHLPLTFPVYLCANGK